MSMLNVSSSPHLRSPHNTSREMYNVILALIPATVFGVFHFGLHALLVILMSVVTACGTEYVFDYISKRPNSLWDLSAVVTGLLLALCLPPSVPLYIPFAGSLFAILFTKCFFGGLGQNFMNPALAGRVFLLISFGTAMIDYSYDGVSGATPLATLNEGGTVSVLKMFLGFASGHIGVSVAALCVGAAYLIYTDTIKWKVPAATLVVFVIIMGIAGPGHFAPLYIGAELAGGGLILGAFFMATDPVTSPMTGLGQLIYGGLIGGLAALFRLKSGMADGMSYAIITANLIVPLLDKYIIEEPWGVGKPGQVLPSEEEMANKKPGIAIPRSALVLCLITAIAGVALGGVYSLTKDTIEANQMAANLAAYQAVVPGAENFAYDEAISASLEEAMAGDYYADGAYGKTRVNEVVAGTDASGNIVGYGLSVTSMEGFDGEITLALGIAADGTVNGISFTVINETAGMGMKADEPEWKAQFEGVKVDSFTLNKSGGSTADNEIDSVSGASITSGAVVNAVNTGLDFYHNYIQ